MTLRSSREWSNMGFRIRTGARSMYRGAGGVPLFSRNQVTPWEYIPARQVDRYITVDGKLYRQV